VRQALRSLPLAATALAAGALAPGPAAAASYPEALAKKLGNVVYVENGAKPKVSVSDEGKLRLRILDKDRGRIKIAVVRTGTANENGGVTGLAHATARHLDLRGTLVIVAGQEVYALTSHPEAGATVQALQEAFRKNEGDRARQLLAAVNAIAAVDPGPKADPQGTPNSSIPSFPDVDDDVEGIFDAFKIGALVVAGAIALPFLAVTIWLLLRFRRSRRREEEVQEDRQHDVRDQLIELGDEIRALDLDAQMPGVTSNSLVDYEAAIEQYDRANAVLARADADSPHRVQEAAAAVAEGMRRIQAARARLGLAPASPGGLPAGGVQRQPGVDA
jgi:hypothetical protein